MAVILTAPSPSSVIAAGAVWPATCTIAVVLRFWTKRHKITAGYVDDWLTIPALVLLWSQCLCLIAGTVKHAIAYPNDPAPPGINPAEYSSAQHVLARQLYFAIQLMQIPCLTLIKLGFVLFYRRIFVVQLTGSKLKLFLDFIAVVLVAWMIAFFFSELFICRLHFDDIWISKSTIEMNSDCVQLIPYDQAFTASDFILDLIVFLLPVVPVFRLKLSRGQKFGLIGIFSLGGLAIAASITRFIIFSDQQTSTSSPFLYWTCTESAVGLLASCLPSIFGYLRNMRRKAKSRLAYNTGTTLFDSRSDSKATKMRSRPDSSASDSLYGFGQGDIRITSDFSVETEETCIESPSQQCGRKIIFTSERQMA